MNQPPNKVGSLDIAGQLLTVAVVSFTLDGDLRLNMCQILVDAMNSGLFISFDHLQLLFRGLRRSAVTCDTRPESELQSSNFENRSQQSIFQMLFALNSSVDT